MNKYILKIEGMRCSMCESHVNDAIRKKIDAKKIKSSHTKNETIIILGLIYRDFLCSLDEKKRLQEKDAKELQEAEKKIKEQIREKYNSYDIFENRNKIVSKEEQPSKETRMTIVQKERWYQKIFNLIKGLFYRNKQD